MHRGMLERDCGVAMSDVSSPGPVIGHDSRLEKSRHFSWGASIFVSHRLPPELLRFCPCSRRSKAILALAVQPGKTEPSQ